MAFTPAANEQYTIRRKVLKLFGAAFHIYDAQGAVVGYCKQKAFKLKEDIRIYTDESMSTELLHLSTQQIIDFSPKFTVRNAAGHVLGILQRKGLASTFVRDEWLILDAAGTQIATLREDSTWLAILRRIHELFAALSPQKFHVLDMQDKQVAIFRQHFNWFVYRLGVAIDPAVLDGQGDDDIDPMLILAAACLISAIEGRQA